MSPIANNSNPSTQMQGMDRMTAEMPPFQPDDIRALARKQVETAMEQIRNANSLIDSIASQFPVAANEVKAAKDALLKVMTKVVGSQSQPESPIRTGVMG